MWGSGLTPQMKMKKKLCKMSSPMPFGALPTAEQQSMEEWQKPYSFYMSSTTVAGPMSSKECIPKSIVKIIPENRTRVD